jgi:hypothetical protein
MAAGVTRPGVVANAVVSGFAAMPRRLLFALAVVVFAGLPAMAKVVAEGKPSSGGHYWQKVQKTNGSIQYLCRQKGDSKVQKDAVCNGAKAVKPK